MAKGLPRSLARGGYQEQTVSKIKVAVDTTVDVTATAAAVGWGTLVLSGLPEAQIKMLGAAAKLTFSGSGADADLSDTWNGDFGIGTTPADDATITAGDVDIIASTALGPAVAEVAPVANAINGTSAVFDNTANTLEINLNVLIDAADIVDDATVTLTVQGVVEFTFITLLDD
jgi:hypothetical protein